MGNNYTENRPQGATTPAANSLETIYTSGEKVIMPQTSLVLENTAVLVDRGRGKLYVRCVFRSITDREIKAVRIELSCQDASGSPLGEGVVFHYMDLKTRRDATFGQNSLIELPDRSARKFQVSVKKVLFADGTMIDGDGQAYPLPTQVLLTAHFGREDLAAEYARETTANARYVPERGNYCWLCTCGAINTNAEKVCHSCGCGSDLLIEALDPTALWENLNASAARQQAAEQQVWPGQQQPAQEFHYAQPPVQPKKRRKNPAAKIIISILLIAALGCGIAFFGIPYFKYRQACDALESGEYDTAYEAFADLGDFMDSDEKADQALYEKAGRAMRNKKYNDAYQIYDRLGAYKDSEERALEARYLQAEQYETEEKYKEAYEIYAELGSYKQSEDELIDTIILWELDVLGSSNVLEAETFCETVTLGSDHYEMFYSTILLFLYNYEDATYWYDWGATGASRNMNTLLQMLPATYEDVSALQELFGLLNEGYIVYDELFRDYEYLVRDCWYLPFVQDLAAQDEAICYFLESYWTTSDSYYYMEFYESNGGGTTSDHDLPWVAKPYGTQYFNIENMIYYWDDINLNHLAEVYRFEIIDYDTINVYCYKNNQTYTLYRN